MGPEGAERGAVARGLVLGAYTLVFWGGLPALLWALAAPLDRWLGRWEASAWGALPLALGAWWVATAIAELRVVGVGWPVSALPPPRLVQSGPYASLRHPIYAGFVLGSAGSALLVGSPGLLLVTVGVFLPAVVAYSAREERVLARRFGVAWSRYTRRVGQWPRPTLVPVARLLRALGVIRVRVVAGAEHLPAAGPAVLVANHACYTDPVFLTLLTHRRVWFPTTAEAFRPGGVMAWAASRWPSFVVRRYRTDPASARALVDLLAAGEVVGVFPERERSVLGAWLGPDPGTARQLARLGVPVIPVGFDGSYDCGPRWAGALSLRPSVRVRIGPPVRWGEDPVADLDAAVRAVLGTDPQPLTLARWSLAGLSAAVWRCPSCGDGPGWVAAELACRTCGARWFSSRGRVLDARGRAEPFADWARRAWRPETEPIVARGRVWEEPSVWGPLRPLRCVAPAEGTEPVELRFGPDGIRWPGGGVELAALRSVTTERSDMLQLATSDRMWQVVVEGVSAFRLQHAVKGWQPATRPRPRPAPPAPVRASAARDWRLEGAAVGLGLATVEGLLLTWPMSEGFGAAGLWAQVLPPAAAYVAVGWAADRAARALGGGRVGALVAPGLVFGAVALATGLPPGLAAAVVLATAGLGAALCHRPTRPLALVAVALALSPALPRPAPPDGGAPDEVSAASGPDVIVVVLDTVPFACTSLGRTDRDTTPNLAALAARGTSYTRARSPSCWSLPAHASLLTGLLPAEHGAHYEHPRLDPSVPTLPALLRDAGWQTAAFTANPLVAPGTGLGRGFDTFEERWRRHTWHDGLLGWRALHRWLPGGTDKGGSAVVAALAGWWERRDPQRRSFVLVNLMEAHVPFQQIPDAWRHRWFTGSEAELERAGEESHLAQVLGTPGGDPTAARLLEDQAIGAADAYLGELRRVVGDDAVWIVLSDHGELLGEHGLWGHNLGLYEPLLRVPLVVAGPGIPVGVDDSPVSLLDVFPTVLQLAGRPVPDGTTALPLGTATPERPIRAEHFRTDLFTSGWQATHPFTDPRPIRARRATVIAGDRKRTRAEGGEDLGYDLAADPGEEHPGPGAATGLELTLPGERNTERRR